MTAMAKKVIVHVDLDAFYASVEVRDNPAYRGRPLVVGGEGRRSVVMAASYEARRFGVHSAMPMMRARALCRDLVVAVPRMSQYMADSAAFFRILGRWSPLVEGLSLDEAFVDLSGTEVLFGDPEDAVRRLRAEVRDELGLACSAGIAPVKFVAKIGSDVAKPDGQVRVHDGDVQAFLDPLPVGRLWGVGEKTEAILKMLGIQTIGDLRRTDVSLLMHKLGPHQSQHLSALAHGRDDRVVVSERDAKSIGTEETFERDITDHEQIRAYLLGQSERVAARLRENGLVARGVTLKYKLKDFTLVTRQTSFVASSDDGKVIYDAVCALLAANPPVAPIRLCGVSAHKLEPRPLPGLFDQKNLEATEKRARLNAALDGIHAKHGDKSIVRARLLDLGQRQNVAEPARPLKKQD